MRQAAAKPDSNPPFDVTVDTPVVELPVLGMSCASCATRIATRLQAEPGVSDAQVNYATGHATVAFDAGVVDRDRLVGVITALGYTVPEPGDDEAELEAHATASVTLRLGVAAALTVPLVVVSMVAALQHAGWEWLALALATPVVTWCAWPFHTMALRGARHGHTTMDTLVSLGTAAAYLWSLGVVLLGAHLDDSMAGWWGGGHDVYFETAAVIVTLLLAGRAMELRARRRSGEALRSLATLAAKTARLESGAEVPVETLVVGDRFVVRPGERIATDGTIVDGAGSADVSMLTGEPVPVDVTVGDTVFGGTIVTSGRIVVQATGVGADTALAQIARLVTDAQGSKAPVQRLADRVVSVFVPVVLGVAVVTFLVWLGAGDAQGGLAAAVAVLIVACPCALGLATPTAILVGTGRGAQLGIIIRGGEVLEAARGIDTVVLDKTGTVTEGRMTLEAQYGDERALRYAAAVEDASEHPVARAIVAGAHERGVVVEAVTGFDSQPGLGAHGEVDGERVRVGRASFVGEVPHELQVVARDFEARGQTIVFAGWAGHARGVFALTDRVKPSSRAAVAKLHQLGLSVVMVTGDRRAVAENVATTIGIERVVADALPGEKLAVVHALQAEGHRVAVVGDGINDAPALAGADLGVAIGTGTDVAIEASDLSLVSGDLCGAPDAIALSRRTLATIKGNLFWAFAYNIAAIPLAACGVLSPMVAAAAMGLSSVFVVTNSLRLRRFGRDRHELDRAAGSEETAVLVPPLA